MISWPDATLAIAHILSVAALLPSVFDPATVIPRRTSVTKTLGAALCIPAHLALGNTYTAVTLVAMFGLWLSIVVYRHPAEPPIEG